MINKIIEETGVKIDIEEDGQVYIYSEDIENANKALKMVKDIATEIELNQIYEAKIVNITSFGAFAQLPGGKEGLIHISKISKERVNKVEDVLHLDDIVTVKVIEIDAQGRINLTMRIDEEEDKEKEDNEHRVEITE